MSTYFLIIIFKDCKILPLIYGLKGIIFQFFKKITLCIRNKSETGKLVINYGVKIIKKKWNSANFYRNLGKR